MYKNCKLILTNYYYKSVTNTLALQINSYMQNFSLQNQYNHITRKFVLISKNYFKVYR